jgi:hypothetical protein
MSDAFEDRLRSHLADQASRVVVDPDPDGLMQRSAGRPRRRGVAVAGAVLAMMLATAGVLTGVNLAGGSTASSSASSVASPRLQRPGASVAPGGLASPNLPAAGGQLRYSLLFTRTTSTGVTIRVYSVGSAEGGCSGLAMCPPTGTVPGPTPCPQTAMCSQPMDVPHEPGSTQPVASGSSAPGAAGTGSADPAPSDSTTGCGQLVVELSTDRAVASGTTDWPNAVRPASGSVAVLGGGSFGTAEGDPASWVAVSAGAGVNSVHLSSGGAAVTDTMVPTLGVAVLAQPGASGLAGEQVVGLDQSGATVGTVPADQTPAVPTCPPPAPPSTTSTTTTVPDPTTTTTAPDTTTTAPDTTTTAPDTTTTSTTAPDTRPTLVPADKTPLVPPRRAP